MLMTQASSGHKARCPDQGAAIDDLFYQSSSAPLSRPSMREKRERTSHISILSGHYKPSQSHLGDAVWEEVHFHDLGDHIRLGWAVQRKY